MYNIPLEIERSLTDDLAFVAAFQSQVDFVSAVAMEQSQSLLFRLAANEGVTTVVKDHFDQVFPVLKSHAHKGSLSEIPCVRCFI
jgi:hypothetical protein